MGQKVNPIGFRIVLDKQWRSRWYSDKRNFGTLLAEDQIIRDAVMEETGECRGFHKVVIERYANRVRASAFHSPSASSSPQGRQRRRPVAPELAKLTGKEIYLEIHEVRDADANAQLVAESIAQQIERRVALRRAIKRAQKIAMDMGVDGIKVRCCGRINNAEIARVEWSKEGKVPLHTMRANIDYGFAEAHTTVGRIGVKVWICKRDDFQPTRTSGPRRKSHAPNA